MLSKSLAIDLGTSATRIMISGKGLVVQQPSVVARGINDSRPLAIGREAQEMIGRTPEQIDSYHPLVSGVIADFRTTELMLAHYISLAIGRLRARRPEGMINVSAGATSTERKAVLDVAHGAGLREVHLIPSPVAAALGAGLPATEPTGNMIIDIGSGTTEVAVLSLGGAVAQNSVRAGGQQIDKVITDYLRKAHSIAIGRQSAEEIKHLIGAAMPDDKRSEAVVHGRDLADGLPKQVTVTSNELVPSIETVLEQIVLAIRSVMERTPPELISDIMQHGIVVSGGGSRLKHLDRLLAKVIGVPVIIAPDPELAVVKGAYQALTSVEHYKRSLLGG
jgi:rod shape-determining protein MreB